MKDLRELADNWDSYGGKAPTEEAISTAEKLSGNATLVPIPDGGVQVEMRAAGWEVEIGVSARGQVESVWMGKSR